ncbi:MAG: hypothetical protein WBM59_11685, partial [Sedimenticolaceae bacterium]
MATDEQALAKAGNAVDGHGFDRRNTDWYVDQGIKILVFMAGISAILFIVGIFVFIGKEGLAFIIDTMDVKEFLTTEYWSPSDEDDPEYGILALIAGTASVTGLAMVVAIPFSLGAAVYIGEFATGKTRETLKVLVELLAAIPSVVWG